MMWNLFLQVALLEEELAGRRSFWRRQRHREDELTEVESRLHRQLMEDEHVTAYHVQEQLENIQEGVFNARKTEKKRRHYFQCQLFNQAKCEKCTRIDRQK